MAEEKFYDEEGRIVSPDKAREIAELEKPARDREAELRRQAETGLTQRERDNIQIIEGLKGKYPDAFESVIDDKGREVLILKRWGVSEKSDVVLTPKGHVFLHPYNVGNIEDIDSTKLVDWIEENQEALEKKHPNAWSEVSYSLIKKEKAKELPPAKRFALARVDLENSVTREGLKARFESTQATALKQKEVKEEFKKATRPEKVLADL